MADTKWIHHAYPKGFINVKRKACDGSSGGSAMALVCGMMPIADGSFMGGAFQSGKFLQPSEIPDVPGQGSRMARAYGMVSDLSAGADGPYRPEGRVDAECHRWAGSALADLYHGSGQFVLESP